MRVPFILSCLLALGTQGCTLRPLAQEGTHRVDNVALSGDLAGTAVAAPFCLHLQHSNQFWVVYSRVAVRAWVTEGRCDAVGLTEPGAAPGPASAIRTVDAIHLAWQQDWHDARHQKTCTQATQCEATSEDVIAGQHLVCASARARVGNQVAMLTSDAARCP